MSSETRYELITLGETMLRLVPPDALRLGQSNTLQVSFGGAESNVAANLARLGRRVSWWSRLPDNPLAHQLAATLRGHGVNVEDVLFVEGERLGTYYVEYGTAPRGIKVWYDRTHSAASHMQPDDLPAPWLASGQWLHLTGITPALSPSCHKTAQFALRQAKANGATTSFDVNYRALLWPPQAAALTLEPYCKDAHLVFIARRDAAQLFEVAEDHIEAVARTLQARWGHTVLVTDSEMGAAAYDGNDIYQVAAPKAEIIDRLGAGDAFASGVIDQLLAGAGLREALAFGTALAALKLSVVGDISHTTREEVYQIVDADQTRLQR